MLRIAFLRVPTSTHVCLHLYVWPPLKIAIRGYLINIHICNIRCITSTFHWKRKTCCSCINFMIYIMVNWLHRLYYIFMTNFIVSINFSFFKCFSISLYYQYIYSKKLPLFLSGISYIKGILEMSQNSRKRLYDWLWRYFVTPLTVTNFVTPIILKMWQRDTLCHLKMQ